MEMMTAYETDGVLLVPFLRNLLSAASGCETHNAHALRAPKHGTAAQFNTIPPTHAPRYETRGASATETPETTRGGGDSGPLRPGNPEWAVAGVRRVVQVVAEAGRALASF